MSFYKRARLREKGDEKAEKKEQKEKEEKIFKKRKNQVKFIGGV